MKSHDTRLRALEAACLSFAVIGLFVATAGRGPLLSAWSDAMARALWALPEVPERLADLEGLMLGILGGSIAGKWTAAWWLVHWPLRRGRAWAWWASVAGLLGWFAIDSAVSAAHGAWFNIAAVNLVPLVIVGALLWSVRDATGGDAVARPASGEAEPVPAGQPRRLLGAVMALFAATGLVFAFGMHSPLMATWRAQAASLYLGGTLDAQAWDLLTFLGGPIGGTVFAHFLMLALAARAQPREATLAAAIAGSVAVWFSIDATSSALHGAWFNIVLIDLPTVVGVGAALMLDRRRASAAQAR